jgi:hypothetical protein
MSLPTFNVPQVLVGERAAAAAVVEQLLALPQPIQPVVEAALPLAESGTLNRANLTVAAS